MSGSNQQDRRIELYVRSLLPGYCREPQTAVIDRIDDLEAEGVAEEYAVHIWGKQAPASPAEAKTDAGVYALDRVAVFREWATENDVSLDPAFETRTVDSAFRDRTYSYLVFPAVLLAEYRDGDLVCVTPHVDAESVVTVADRLCQLANAEDVTYHPLEQAAAGAPASLRAGAGSEPVASE